MVSIYKNAHITIAATASADANHGFLFPRPPAKHLKIYSEACLPQEELFRNPKFPVKCSPLFLVI